MFQDFFNRLLKQSQGYENLKQKVHSLEKEIDHLRQSKPSSTPEGPPTKLMSFPPTLTININKKDNQTPIRAFTKKINTRPNYKSGKQKRDVDTSQQLPPVSQSPQVQKEEVTSSGAQVLHAQGGQHDLPSRSNGESQEIPTSPTNYNQRSPGTGSSSPTYIEFLNVEQIVIDRYEQSNNFGALGIKSLEGKLNIGANYGDKSPLPEEVQNKLDEKLQTLKAMKNLKKTTFGSDAPPGEDAQMSSHEKTDPWDAHELFEDDWEDFFQHQPIYAENNKRQHKKRDDHTNED